MKLAIDPGHGGVDCGAVANGHRESDIVLVYADALTTELRDRGHSVLQTRTDDQYLELHERAECANGQEAAAFVSLHVNAAADLRASGAWVIHCAGSTRGHALAVATFTRLCLVPGMCTRVDAIYPDASGWTGSRRLAALRKTKMPAVLIELGFITNRDDVRRLTEPGAWLPIVRAIADGIEAWHAGEQEAAP